MIGYPPSKVNITRRAVQAGVLHDTRVHAKQEGVVAQDDSYEHNFGRNSTWPGLMLGSYTKSR
jgi:hypothetical protein